MSSNSRVGEEQEYRECILFFKESLEEIELHLDNHYDSENLYLLLNLCKLILVKLIFLFKKTKLIRSVNVQSIIFSDNPTWDSKFSKRLSQFKQNFQRYREDHQ